MYVIKDELEHWAEKFAQIMKKFLSNKSNPDAVKLFRIRLGLIVPNPTGSIQTQKKLSSCLTLVYAASSSFICSSEPGSFLLGVHCTNYIQLIAINSKNLQTKLNVNEFGLIK